MGAVKIILLVLGVIILLVGIGGMFVGGALVWVDQARTDDEGFIGTKDMDLGRDSRAIITPPIDLDEEAIDFLRWIDLGTVRLVGRSDDPSKKIFMGIASSSDVEDYLDDVDHDEMTLAPRWMCFGAEYEERQGDRVLAPPASETFWLASAHGAGTQVVDWEPEEGSFTIVLMNDDGSAGVDLTASLRAKVHTAILAIGVGFLAGGIALVAVAVLMIYFAVRRSHAGNQSAVRASTAYPATLSIDYPDRPLNRLTTFLRPLTAIPICVVLGLLVGATSAWEDDPWRFQGYAVGGIVILPLVLMLLFRQKYPRWWFDWNLAVARFTVRVAAYGALLRDEYPSTDEDQAVHIEVPYPNARDDLNRWLPLVKWFLAIPHYVVLFFLSIAAVVVVIVCWFAILFTGRYPQGLGDFVVGVFRWYLRVGAYAFLLTTDRYPPFRLAE